MQQPPPQNSTPQQQQQQQSNIQQYAQPPQQYNTIFHQGNQSPQQWSNPPQQFAQPHQQYNQPHQQYNQAPQQYNQPAQQWNQPLQQYDRNQINIMPLPAHLGWDATTVVNQATQLRCQERSYTTGVQITDMFGREVVVVQEHGMSASSRHTFTNGATGKVMFEMKVKSPFNSFKSRSWVLKDPSGKEIGTADHARVCAIEDRIWSFHFKNTASNNQDVTVSIRGKWKDNYPTIMWNNVPAIVIDRTNAGRLYPDGQRRFQNNDPRPYNALVAPGSDLVWAAAVLAIYEILYYHAN